jgi:hypothetical protein
VILLEFSKLDIFSAIMVFSGPHLAKLQNFVKGLRPGSKEQKVYFGNTDL